MRCTTAAATIDKSSLRVFPANISGSEDAPKDKAQQWKHGLSVRVNGPITDGRRLNVSFSYPGHKDWSTFTCKLSDTPEGLAMDIDECLGPDKFTTDYTGPVNFVIKLHNEFAGSDTTLFAGTAKVEEFIGPAGAQHPDFMSMRTGASHPLPHDVIDARRQNAERGQSTPRERLD